jgi:hypothetical protein
LVGTSNARVDFRVARGDLVHRYQSWLRLRAGHAPRPPWELLLAEWGTEAGSELGKPVPSGLSPGAGSSSLLA